jgi:hypothetical protein
MKKLVWLAAMAAGAGLPTTVKLENNRVHVIEVTAAPGPVRERTTR